MSYMYKADVSSVSPSSERKKEGPADVVFSITHSSSSMFCNEV